MCAVRGLMPYVTHAGRTTTTDADADARAVQEDATRATQEDADADAQKGDEGSGSRIHEPGFVDALRSANDELVRAVKEVHSSSTSELENNGNGKESQEKKAQKEAMSRVYASFVKEWCARGIDANLVSFLSFLAKFGLRTWLRGGVGCVALIAPVPSRRCVH